MSGYVFLPIHSDFHNILVLAPPRTNSTKGIKQTIPEIKTIRIPITSIGVSAESAWKTMAGITPLNKKVA